jgi:hypothetical protein
MENLHNQNNEDEYLLPKMIPLSNYEYLLTLKKTFFNQKYSSLSDNKKIFFDNKLDFHDKREYINFTLNGIRIKAFSIFFLTGYGMFMVMNQISNHMIHQRRFQKISILCTIFTSFISYKVYHYKLRVDLNQGIASHSKFGLFLWLDLNYKYNFLSESNINTLDQGLIEEYEYFEESKNVSIERKLKLIYFFTLKHHYLDMLIKRKQLRKLGKIKEKFFTVKNYELEKSEKSSYFLKEMDKMILEPDLKGDNSIEINESNYKHIFSDYQIKALNMSFLTLKELKNYLKI